MVWKGVKGGVTKRGFPVDISDHYSRGGCIRETGNYICDFVLLGIPQYESDFWHVSQCFWCYLGVAAGHNDPGAGISLLCPSDELTGLVISFMGNGTGVDNVDIRVCSEVDNLKALCQ